MLCLPTYHWPKQVTWLDPETRGGGQDGGDPAQNGRTLQNYITKDMYTVYWRKRKIRAIFATHKPYHVSNGMYDVFLLILRISLFLHPEYNNICKSIRKGKLHPSNKILKRWQTSWTEFTKEDIQMVNKYMKMCSVLLYIWDMQMKTKYDIILKPPKCCPGCEAEGFSWTVAIKW